MDEMLFRDEEPPARLIAMQIYQESFMKRRSLNKHGRARLEIFNTEDELNATRPSRIVLLDDCLSIRVVDLQDEPNRHLKLQLRDGTSLALKADNVFALRTQLSRLAFPTQFVSLNRPFSMDSPTTPPDVIQTENSLPIPVLLLQTVEGLQEGSYGLLFSEENLELRKEDKPSVLFDYENIHWIASGDYCFGFETNKSWQLYEFKCTQPQQIIDNYRKKCKFRTHFHPTSRPTVNHYLRFYYPDILRSGESTLSAESKNTAPSSSGLMTPTLTGPSKFACDYEEIPPNQIRNVRFAPVVTTEMNTKPKNKIVGFLKNISPFGKSPAERSAFEPRANDEFRLAAARKRSKSPVSKSATVIRYNPETRQPRIGNSQPLERPVSMPSGTVLRPGLPGSEPLYSPIPLAIASSPLDPSITTLVSHLAPASRVSLASATPAADAARVSRVEILQSTYID